MKKWTYYAKKISPFICAGLVITLLTGACSGWKERYFRDYGFGLFSWDAAAMDDGENLDLCIKRAGVTAIYQQFPAESLNSGSASGFVKQMRRQSVDVYALVGEAEWAYEPDGSQLLRALRRVARYNENQRRGARISGVMVDIEPYLLKEWDRGGAARDGLMESYLSCIQNAYSYTSERDLELWVCIPTFYDATSQEVLEELISSACDGVAVMNYNRTDEYGQMEEEAGYAQEYDKGVICVYELQEPGKHQLDEINTYAEVGLEELWKSSQRLKNQFSCERLTFAYHYYKPLQEMLARMERTE